MYFFLHFISPNDVKPAILPIFRDFSSKFSYFHAFTPSEAFFIRKNPFFVRKSGLIWIVNSVAHADSL